MSEVPHNRLTFGEAECDAVLRAVRSGRWAQGPRVEELEQVLAQMASVRYAVCVASGLSALRLSLGALGVAAENHVLVPAYSCVALANAVLAWGAHPVPVDVERGKWTIDPTEASGQCKNCRPKAGIAVNTFGIPTTIETIGDSAWIEDCAHAFGSQVGGRALGARAPIGILSFYATKLIGGGEGGAVLTNSSEIREFVKCARDYADHAADAHRLNDKMNDLEASLVLAQLERLPNMLAARTALAERYLKLLSEAATSGVFVLPRNESPRVWYRFAVEMSRVSAATVVHDLLAFGIHAAIPITDWRAGSSPAAPIADQAYRSIVSLPLYPTLSEREQDFVIGAFLKLCEGYKHA